MELMSALLPPTEAGKSGFASGMKNAFEYEDPDKIEKLNEELRSKYLVVAM